MVPSDGALTCKFFRQHVVDCLIYPVDPCGLEQFMSRWPHTWADTEVINWLLDENVNNTLMPE